MIAEVMPVARRVLLLAAFALSADAAPQLKPERPAPGTEAARIEALRAKYDAVRKAATPAELLELAVDEAAARRLAEDLAHMTKGDREMERAIVKNIGIEKPRVRDLYEIAAYDRDRKKAAGRK